MLQNNKYDCNQLYLKKNIFREFLQLYDKKMFDRIFEIFGEIDDKYGEIITLDSLKYLYYSFTNDDPKIKFILITFLIFCNKKSMGKIELINNIFLTLNSELSQSIYKLVDLVEINSEKSKNKKTNYKKFPKSHKKIKESEENFYFEIIIEREDFINSFKFYEKTNKNFLTNFHFLKKFTCISKFKFDPNNPNNLDFYCDCGISKPNEKIIKETDNLNTMKKEYDVMTHDTNNVLYFSVLKKNIKKK